MNASFIHFTALGVKSKPKKTKLAGGKHIVPPIPLDNAGRPMFPLVLGDLTLYSIGEVNMGF